MGAGGVWGRGVCITLPRAMISRTRSMSRQGFYHRLKVDVAGVLGRHVPDHGECAHQVSERRQVGGGGKGIRGSHGFWPCCGEGGPFSCQIGLLARGRSTCRRPR